jgi:hypothetical protein
MWHIPKTSPDQEKNIAFQATVDYIQKRPSPCYAITDAARDDTILEFVQQNSDIVHCLYRGDAKIRLANYAPYLFRVDPGDSAIRRFLNKGWGQSWYILLTGSSAIDAVLTQLRKTLIVRPEAGKSLYFRFYDPRVLRSYLPLCSQADIAKLMGKDIETLFCETHDAKHLFQCHAHTTSLIKRISGTQRDYRQSRTPLIETPAYG